MTQNGLSGRLCQIRLFDKIVPHLRDSGLSSCISPRQTQGSRQVTSLIRAVFVRPHVRRGNTRFEGLWKRRKSILKGSMKNTQIQKRFRHLIGNRDEMCLNRHETVRNCVQCVSFRYWTSLINSGLARISTVLHDAFKTIGRALNIIAYMCNISKTLVSIATHPTKDKQLPRL